MPQTSAPANATHGPFFPECGGISDQEVISQTRVPGLVNTAKTSVGCQWLSGGSIVGPHFSFTWFRGSPIGRERKTEELTRASVEDINIEGHNGFIATGDDPILGTNLCEIGIGLRTTSSNGRSATTTSRSRTPAKWPRNSPASRL